MKNDRILLSLRVIIKNINLIVICYISTLIALTTYKIADSMGAREFLEEIRQLPAEPWKIPLRAIGFFLLLLLLMQVNKERFKKDLHFSLYAVVTIGLSMIIMNDINMNYNGIVLLIMIDILSFSQNFKLKIPVLGFLFVLYIFSTFDLVSNMKYIISVQTYLQYYSRGTRNILAAIKTLLNSFSNISFIAYMIFLIRVQVIENERIRQLNVELDKTNEKLQEANGQLEEYAKTAEKISETRERNRLAREIHDTLGHALTGIIAGIDACGTLIDFSKEDTRKQLTLIGNVARQGIKDVRRSVSALRPDALERLTLGEAIRQSVSDMKSVTNAVIDIENNIETLKLDEDEEEAIYRIVQESITNAIRHGKADYIHVKLEKVYNVVHITIRDNGIGCKQIVQGFGLRHMKERAELLNGSIEYESSLGFTIYAKIPIRWGNHYD